MPEQKANPLAKPQSFKDKLKYFPMHTLVRPYGFAAERGNSSVHGTSFGQPYTVAEDENTS